ncbi:MAG: flagellar basal body-associated FliL family protein [Deltaproteobacteria bacterium]|nr:flagellar basal body-associated FliL family protein [Deltaproteobacteria bacterium]
MTLLSRFVVTGYYKKVLMVMCLCVVVFVGSGFVGDRGSGIGDQGPEVRGQGSGVREQGLCEERFGYFNDFIVHLKDSNGKDRFLICDVVIELNQGMELPKERVELRKIIYKTLKELSGSPEIRRELKETIKIRLNNFMDDEILKGVYITRFILL